MVVVKHFAPLPTSTKQSGSSDRSAPEECLNPPRPGARGLRRRETGCGAVPCACSCCAFFFFFRVGLAGCHCGVFIESCCFTLELFSPLRTRDAMMLVMLAMLVMLVIRLEARTEYMTNYSTGDVLEAVATVPSVSPTGKNWHAQQEVPSKLLRHPSSMATWVVSVQFVCAVVRTAWSLGSGAIVSRNQGRVCT